MNTDELLTRWFHFRQRADCTHDMLMIGEDLAAALRYQWEAHQSQQRIAIKEMERADRAERERDEARALLREAREWVRYDGSYFTARIDAALGEK